MAEWGMLPIRFGLAQGFIAPFFDRGCAILVFEASGSGVVQGSWDRGGTRGSAECLLFVLGRVRYRWQVKNGFRRQDRGFLGRNPRIFVGLPGFWAVVNKNHEW